MPQEEASVASQGEAWKQNEFPVLAIVLLSCFVFFFLFLSVGEEMEKGPGSSHPEFLASQFFLLFLVLEAGGRSLRQRP